MSIHIIPINDLKEHEESSTCECSPRLEMEDGEMIFIHNSFDGREKEENNDDYVELGETKICQFTGKLYDAVKMVKCKCACHLEKNKSNPSILFFMPCCNCINGFVEKYRYI